MDGAMVCLCRLVRKSKILWWEVRQCTSLCRDADGRSDKGNWRRYIPLRGCWWFKGFRTPSNILMSTSPPDFCPFHKLYVFMSLLLYEGLMDIILSSSQMLHSLGISTLYMLLMWFPSWLFGSSRLTFGFKISWRCKYLFGVAYFCAPLYPSFQ